MMDVANDNPFEGVTREDQPLCPGCGIADLYTAHPGNHGPGCVVAKVVHAWWQARKSDAWYRTTVFKLHGADEVLGEPLPDEVGEDALVSADDLTDRWT